MTGFAPLLSLQEWFRRLAEQRCFASHPGDPQTKSVPPQEAAKMLSVLNASEVSDVINRAVCTRIS